MKKKKVTQISDNDLKKIPITHLLEGWSFDVDELSMLHFRVSGVDRWGRSASRDGFDPKELLLAVLNDIYEMFPDEFEDG